MNSHFNKLKSSSRFCNHQSIIYETLCKEKFSLSSIAEGLSLRFVHDRSGIMVREVKFVDKILPVYSLLDIKVK